LEAFDRIHCFHCGTSCRETVLHLDAKAFCCRGCLTVFELLTENGLGGFYQLGEAAGVRITTEPKVAQFQFLDEPSVRERLVDFTNDRITRATFHLPAIHCVACVWLLENLFRLRAGIGSSVVNFPRKEISFSIENGRVQLGEVAALLTSLGYEPKFKLSDLEAPAPDRAARRLWLQLGVAGFAFGNIMLFSLSSYLGLDSFSGPGFRRLTGWISFALALPVFFYSAADYWRAAWVSLRQRLLNIDVPIAAGIAALFGQSVYEWVSGRGEGYFDSLAGLLFFLLCGKLFQRKTYDRLVFDRDYKSFFPLSVTRRCGGRHDGTEPSQPETEERVSLSQLAVGDRLLLRNGELVPADAWLIDGPALIDYSFVTGESEPVEKKPGDYLYAGGRQMGGAIEMEMAKPVSQSYLTSLWNQDAFRKDRVEALNAVTNAYSQRFTRIVIAIALGSAAVWAWVDPAVALKAFTSVLIVACPCALALAAPFALGTAQRVLGRRRLFLKNPGVIETLAKVDAVVFDKTGTLTATGAASVAWIGEPLTEAEECRLYSMTRHSTHPLAVRVGGAIARGHFPEPVRSFIETAGCGMEATVAGREIWMGSERWLASRGVAVARPAADEGATVHVAIDGRHRGRFTLASALRPEAGLLLSRLSAGYETALLSGDNERERPRFAALFGRGAELRFHQSPLDKLEFIHGLQRRGRTVLMAGDGLNDAGALRQSDVGVAVVESVGAFSPASDIIMAAGMVPRLAEVLRFSRQSMRVVRIAFLISAAYNIVGVAIAASGRLSPVVCAILMPLSSVTVIAFACGVTAWLGRGLADGVADSGPARNREVGEPDGTESVIPNPGRAA
jgi:Cu+-exporting ATPase